MAGAKDIPRQPQPDETTIAKSIEKKSALVVGNRDSCLRFRFNRFDPKGPGKLLDLATSKNKSKNLLTSLLDRLGSLESRTAAEVFEPGEAVGIIYQVEDLPTPESKKRLLDLELDDSTEIARISVGNLARLYGLLSDDRTEFFALWWDHSHKIWPSKKFQ
ncbi:hypothetical protein MINTMi198_15700 [Mycobacterium intracellulare M.i.198]|uniref:hypothetical protein n=1 Tax=Mycobacterium intracellulare TaxID=1767 RepID=UPI0011D2A405|nr:hypothetical protein [Mycobacterium intracellulare]MDM3896674.1 hypothetical protein [Mycobacterium intracellulare]BCP36200.1 hypothetical protein MINTMi198_15700 [Mycobacterium intracellulare M.i.198]